MSEKTFKERLEIEKVKVWLERTGLDKMVDLVVYENGSRKFVFVNKFDKNKSEYRTEFCAYCNNFNLCSFWLVKQKGNEDYSEDIISCARKEVTRKYDYQNL